jgi:hypothetical protein
MMTETRMGGDSSMESWTAPMMEPRQMENLIAPKIETKRAFRMEHSKALPERVRRGSDGSLEGLSEGGKKARVPVQ